MKFSPITRAAVATSISLLLVCHNAAAESGKATPENPALSAHDLTKISERMRQTGEDVRVDLKRARARFEAQEVQRQREAEHARQQAIKENALRQEQKAEQARERQLAAQAQAERQRQEVEQAKLQTERKKQAMLSAQVSKEDERAVMQARKEKAAEALRKARASVGVKAFGE